MTLANPYDTPPDFNLLAQAIPAFAPYVLTTAKGAPTINFKDEAALRSLTSALLERDFSLKLDLPPDRLCPIVPGRLEYVLWMLEISSYPSDPQAKEFITGIDIGTGASAIYALLASRTLPNVRMVATDIDDHSLSYARRNIDQNSLADRVALRKSNPATILFPEEIFANSQRFDFSMCNPPFYASAEEVAESLAAKEYDPHAVCTGGSTEMVTEGGEAAFVGRMVAESISLGDRVGWFSSLLGKLSSVIKLVELLQQHHIDNYAIKDVVHGKTKRWLLAWSLQPSRLSNSLARSSNTPTLQKLLPTSTSSTYHCPAPLSPTSTTATLSQAFDSLNLSTAWIAPNIVDLSASSNTWSRGARRKKARGEDVDLSVAPGTLPFLQCRISLAEESPTAATDQDLKGDEGLQVVIEAQWIFGRDHAAFASLAAHLYHRLADAAVGLERESGKGLVEGLGAMDLS